MIHKKIIEVMKLIDSVSKDKRNQAPGANYSFRGIDDIYNHLHPLMAKVGLFSVPKTEERIEEKYQSKSGGSMLRVVMKTTYTFFAEDGSNVVVGPIFSEGNDSSDKASNKALSAAHKYALLQLFCIPTESLDDADNESPECPPSNGFKKLEEKIEKPKKIKNFAEGIGDNVEPEVDPENYIFQKGSAFAGKKMGEVPIEEIEKYYFRILDWINAGNVPQPQSMRMMNNMERHLTMMGKI